NDAVRDAELATIIARVTAEAPNRPALVGQPDSELERAAEAHGLEFIAEAFIDRAYEPDGRLVSRSEPGAVHTDINTVTAQAVSLSLDKSVTARNGDVIDVRADTLCIHGDTEGAAAAARAVRDVLEQRGVGIQPVGG
ncbi:MAG: LamB/YcsF family protein, partial [Planctomycetota bacterium]